MLEWLTPDQIPLWLKVACTLFICILVPVYWIQYGPGNFLWFSDIALFGAATSIGFMDGEVDHRSGCLRRSIWSC